MKNKKLMLVGFGLISSFIIANSANAQGWRENNNNGRPNVTLFNDKDFQGERRFITNDIPDLTIMDFNDRTKSLIAQGNWEICEDPYYRKCVIISGENRALGNMHRKISSIRYVGGNNNGNRPDRPNRYEGRPVAGINSTFYPNYVDGYRNNQRDADDFCRSQGKNGAIAFGSVSMSYDRLGDVLCRN